MGLGWREVGGRVVGVSGGELLSPASHYRKRDPYVSELSGNDGELHIVPTVEKTEADW